MTNPALVKIVTTIENMGMLKTTSSKFENSNVFKADPLSFQTHVELTEVFLKAARIRA